MINKDGILFQYKSGDLVYIISPLNSQLCTASRKVMIKYVGPVVIYKIICPHNYLLMTSDGKMLRCLFEHERLKPATIRTSKGNVQNLAHLYYWRSYAKSILNKNIRTEKSIMVKYIEWVGWRGKVAMFGSTCDWKADLWHYISLYFWSL